MWKNLRGISLAVALPACAAMAARADTIKSALLPVAARKPAPAFTLQDAAGKNVRLSDYRGKVVLLNFWATNCGGCRLEIPSFQELDHDLRGKGLVVVGVSMDILYEGLKNAQEAWALVKPFIQ